jgi:high-affinity iron transporter
MNWFFHKIYWTGWIALHNKKKRHLLAASEDEATSNAKVLLGMGMLGFTSFYREGVEVVLFLQSYRLKLGSSTVGYGVLLGLLFTGIVAVLTFAAHRKLPYRRMLVFTGIMLGAVLMVMVGEQAQEMQLAHWLPTTPIPFLARIVPAWMGLWLSVFPTVETLAAQVLAAVAVVGSYFVAQRHADLHLVQRFEHRAAKAAHQDMVFERHDDGNLFGVVGEQSAIERLYKSRVDDRGGMTAGFERRS